LADGGDRQLEEGEGDEETRHEVIPICTDQQHSSSIPNDEATTPTTTAAAESISRIAI
jgi:hypothetical protein